MAIKNFKTILDNKAYRINASDRKIFENGELTSFFGLNSADNIEFIVYDANDNQLPQGDYGLVRYIPMTTDTINDYILIPEDTLMTQNNFPTEYFVDVERLLNDAGYTNGIFKTQITLINKRVGSENVDDKLWIKEISPTRNEVRLLLLKPNGEDPTELQRRFNIFTNNSNFSEDILPNIHEFLDKITPVGVEEYISNTYTSHFLDRLKVEYQIPNMNVIATRVHTQFIRDVIAEFDNWTNLELSIDALKLKCTEILKGILNEIIISSGDQSGSTTLTTIE